MSNNDHLAEQAVIPQQRQASPGQVSLVRARLLQRALREQLDVTAALDEQLEQAQAQLLAERATFGKRVAELVTENKRLAAEVERLEAIGNDKSLSEENP